MTELVVATWNVNSVASSVKEMQRLATEHKPHAICLQEIKRAAPLAFEGYTTHWTPCSFRGSYAGTAILVRSDVKHSAVPDFTVGLLDDEGRTTVVYLEEFKTHVVSVYSPNAGVNKKTPLARLDVKVEWQAKFGEALKKLGSRVVAGDLNVAVREVDVHNPKTLRRKAGFTDEERSAFNNAMEGYSDAWTTTQGPHAEGFTFFGSYAGLKENNKGWRLDYQLCTPDIGPLWAKVETWYESSDHVPLVAGYRRLK